MKQIKVRDFQRQFYSLLSEDLEVVNASGVVVGRWIIGDGQLTAKPKPQIETNKIVGEPTCHSCKKPALYSGVVHHDGEEVMVYLCSYHFANQPQKKNFKKIL